MVKDLKLKQDKTEEEAKIAAIWEASEERYITRLHLHCVTLCSISRAHISDIWEAS